MLRKNALAGKNGINLTILKYHRCLDTYIHLRMWIPT